MVLQELRLEQYRNYETLCFKPGPHITLLLGDNAQGKTNLLEAIYLTSTGRSHRTRADKDLIRWGERRALIKVQVQHTYASHSVQMELFAQPRQKRSIQINGAPIERMGDLMGQVNAVLFAPEDLRLIQSGPQERRRFLDMLLSQASPGYFFVLQRYQKALKQRNALLRLFAHGRGKMDMMDLWDAQLAQAGTQIRQRRAPFLEKLETLAAQCHSDITSREETLSLQYRVGPQGVQEQDLLQALFAARQDDIRHGTTSVGPHRDDLVIRIQQRDARLFASQGQQRTAVLSLKLAELHLLRESTGEAPLLLLDDVMSELDARRRDALLEHMLGTQTFLTAATDLPAIDVPFAIWKVQAGTLV